MYCYALKINIYTQKFGFINPKTKMGVYSLNFFFWLPFNLQNNLCTFGVCKTRPSIRKTEISRIDLPCVCMR